MLFTHPPTDLITVAVSFRQACVAPGPIGESRCGHTCSSAASAVILTTTNSQSPPETKYNARVPA